MIEFFLMIIVCIPLLIGVFRLVDKHAEKRIAELTAAEPCKHEKWAEVISTAHELVAYLCLNKDCDATLYAWEWEPKGCSCLRSKKYSRHCPVKYHSGWAVLFDPNEKCGCEKCLEEQRRVYTPLYRSTYSAYSQGGIVSHGGEYLLPSDFYKSTERKRLNALQKQELEIHKFFENNLAEVNRLLELGATKEFVFRHLEMRQKEYDARVAKHKELRKITSQGKDRKHSSKYKYQKDWL